jgi:hypothetical protein
VRDAAGKVDALEPPRHLSLGIREDLAMLGRYRGRQVLAMFEDELAQSEQQVGPPPERRSRPGPGRVHGQSDRRVDLGGGRKADLCYLDAPSGVIDRSPSTGISRLGPTTHPVTDGLHTGQPTNQTR